MARMLAVGGLLLLGLGLPGLLPMILEAVAVRSAGARFDLRRLEPVEDSGDAVLYRCGSARVSLRDAPTSAERPVRSDGTVVEIRIGDRRFTTRTPVRVDDERDGPDRYGRVVVPFRWSDRDEREEGCAVVHSLPFDTAAVTEKGSSAWVHLPGGTLFGGRSLHHYGLRFRVLRWSEGGSVRVTEFGWPEWDDDPWATLVLNLVSPTAVGVRNQTLSYWPSLLFPVVYPLGVSVLGVGLMCVGVLVVVVAPRGR